MPIYTIMAKRTTSGKVLTDLIIETFRFNGALIEAGNRITEPLGLTSARWQVLGAIEIAGQDLTVSQIARRMGLSRQAVQRIVNDLVLLEMLKTNPNIDHKRSPIISLSKKGKKVMAEIDKLQGAWVNQLGDNLSERQINQTLKLVQKLRKRLEENT